MRLMVEDNERTFDDTFTINYKRNSSVDYTAPCSNPNCHEYGTRNQYGCDETCRVCGSPIDWSKQIKWGGSL